MVFGIGKKNDLSHEPGVKELRRIAQEIFTASSKHNDLSAARVQNTAEGQVKKVLEIYDALVAYKFSLLKEIREERGEKSKALESLRKQRETYEQQLHTQQAEHLRIVAQLKEAHCQRESRLREEYEAEKQQIQQVAEDLKQDLSSREHVKGLTDREVASRFKKLSAEIEDFSRIDWNPQLGEGWPFSETELDQLHPHNVRRLKRQILQNSLWLSLHEGVFRSPFRIIGSHGQDFDSDVYEAYNPGYDELEEDERSELNMKRCENAKVFLAALGPSGPRSAISQSVMQSYQRAREALLLLISNTLAKVTTLDREEKHALDGILQIAAKLWLEVCSQRYRLFVIIPNGNMDVLRHVRKDTGELRLVVKPGLQRFGDSKGTDMNQGEWLAGWRSEVETYPIPDGQR